MPRTLKYYWLLKLFVGQRGVGPNPCGSALGAPNHMQLVFASGSSCGHFQLVSMPSIRQNPVDLNLKLPQEFCQICQGRIDSIDFLPGSNFCMAGSASLFPTICKNSTNSEDEASIGDRV